MGGRGGKSNMGAGTTSMTPTQFDKYVQENGTEIIYHGYSAASQEELQQRINELLTGIHRESGERTSAAGRGLYFANNETEASGYVTRRQSEQGHEYGRVSVATLRKDAKIGDQNTIKALYQQKHNEYSEIMSKAFEKGITKAESKTLGDKANALYNMDIGTYAKSKGYDALRTYDGNTIVLNQKKLIYRRGN